MQRKTLYSSIRRRLLSGTESMALLSAGVLATGASSAATLTVTTFADETTTNMECSLREALANASSNMNSYTDCLVAGDPGLDTVQFASGLGTGTVSLAGSLLVQDNLSLVGNAYGVTIASTLTGGLIISASTAIDNLAFEGVAGISANPILDIDGTDLSVSLDRVSVSNHRSSGAPAIDVDLTGTSSLVIDNTTVSSSTGGRGLSVNVAGSVQIGPIMIAETPSVNFDNNQNGAMDITLSNSISNAAITGTVFSNNTALGASASGLQASVSNEASLSLNLVQFIDNVGSGGILIPPAKGLVSPGSSSAMRADVSSGAVSVNDSLFMGNRAGQAGGALYVRQSGTGMPLSSVTVSNSIFEGNATRDFGFSYGGAVLLEQQGYSTATITSSTFNDNFARNDGGAMLIYSQGASNYLSIYDSTFTNNTALAGYGGALVTRGSRSPIGPLPKGGASCFSPAPIPGFGQITDSEFSGNRAGISGGAIASVGLFVGPTICSSTLSDNIAGDAGGAVFARGPVGFITAQQKGAPSYPFYNVVQMNNATLTNNVATNGGGFAAGGASRAAVAYAYSSQITGNTATLWGGGAFAAPYGLVASVNSQFTGNTAGERGGGIAAMGSDSPMMPPLYFGGAFLGETTLQANTATVSGGALHLENSYGRVGYSSLVQNEISGESPTSGAGMQVTNSYLTLFASTISGNTADSGGGIGAQFDTSDAYMYFVTIANNGAVGVSSINTGAVDVGYSIIAGHDIDVNPEASGLTVSDSVFQTGSNAGTGNVQADPLLSALQPLTTFGPGRSTVTYGHLLLEGSPAIDATTLGTTDDQRGAARGQGAGDDLGAIEMQSGENTPPTATLSLLAPEIDEAGGQTALRITLDSPALADLQVDLDFSGTAEAEDFAVDTPIVFPAGAIDLDIPITGVDDAVFEGTESLETALIAVVPASGANIAGVTVQSLDILDDELMPSLSMAFADAEVAENGGTTTLTGTLSGLSEADVDFDIEFGGAASTMDFMAADNALTIAGGSLSSSTSIMATDDSLREGDESLTARALSISGATAGSPIQASTVIVDDEPIPEVSLSPSMQSIAENGGVASITATLSGPSESDVLVALDFSGQAFEGIDYVPSARFLTIPGTALAAGMTITALDDNALEGNESLAVDIASASGAVAGPMPSAQVTITDDPEDLPGVDVAISIVDGSDEIGEGAVFDYRIIVANNASLDVTGAPVVVSIPDEVSMAQWVCTGDAGTTCQANGVGGIDDAVDLPAGTSVEYLLTVVGGDAAQNDQVILIANVLAPVGTEDISPANNVATDINALVAEVLFADGFEPPTSAPPTAKSRGALPVLTMDSKTLKVHERQWRGKTWFRVSRQVDEGLWMIGDWEPKQH